MYRSILRSIVIVMSVVLIGVDKQVSAQQSAGSPVTLPDGTELQAIDFVVGGIELLKAKDPQISRAAAALIDHLSEAMEDPQSIAKSIVSSLHLTGSPGEAKEVTTKREAALKKLVDDAEKLRTNSIYVDLTRLYKSPDSRYNSKTVVIIMSRRM